jgi:GTP-binding protein
MSFTVAIVGRPNVGKSTLFNRLIGKRHALVDDTPGVTRDRRQGDGKLGDLRFRLFDTAGFEDAHDETLESRMRDQTESAVRDADVVMMLIDARAGVTPLDAHFGQWLRKQPQPVLLVANKCEGRAGMPGFAEAYRLGLGEPIAVSAEHGEGLSELYDRLLEAAPIVEPEAYVPEEEDGRDQVEESPDGSEVWTDTEAPKTIRLTIVGRPNVGKSTLLNHLLGEARVLTGPEAGITRDSIEVEWKYRDQPIQLVDTAGMRKRARIDDRLERMSVEDTRRSIRFAHVVLLVLDAQDGLERQDLSIARMTIDEGRSLVVVVNKWDAIKDRSAALRSLRERLEDSLPQAKGVAYVTISAERGRNIDKMMAAVLDTYAVWNRRIATAPLNKWLAGQVQRHPPPLVEGRRIKLRYVTQVKARPPSFAAFISRPAELPESYTRYLVNGLREVFGLPGVPVRFMLRGGRNPYVKKDQ